MILPMPTLAELLETQKKLQEEIQRKRQEERSSVIEQIMKQITDYDLRREDLFPRSKKQSKKPDETSEKTTNKPKLPPKYRNPEDMEATWSGKGRAPAWFDRKKDEKIYLISEQDRLAEENRILEPTPAE
jgi:DNA-binding protein H-NS